MVRNFEKKLEDASEEELYFWVNERDFRIVPLASDELTRRRLKKLEKTIQNLDATTSRYSNMLVILTALLFVIGFLQLFISIGSFPASWYTRLIIFILFSYCVYITMRFFEKRLKK